MAEKAASAAPPVSTKAGEVQPVRATGHGGQTGWLPALRVQRLQELAGNRATSVLLSSQIHLQLTRPTPERRRVDQGRDTPLVSGDRLDAATRARMEASFATSLSDVSIHSDGVASGVAQRYNARALTLGEDIFFAAGSYAPGTPSGDHLIAHEIAHVLQQRRGGGVAASPAPGTGAETEAGAAAEAVAGGGSIHIGQATAPGIARQITTEDIMELSDDQIESEHRLAVEWLSKHTASDAEYARTAAYVERLEEVIRSRNPSRIARGKRRQELVEQAVHPSLKRTVGLAVLGLNPTEVAIGTAFVEGLEEAIDDQPPQRKERILDRFGKIFFSSGSWGDKGRFLAGFGWGFVVGIGKEIWGILRIFYDVPKLMWQANQCF